MTTAARDPDARPAPHNLRRQEIVVHLFLPADGRLGPAGYERVREIWAACRQRLLTDQPIPALGVADTLPADPDALPRTGLLAAQERVGPGVFQALLRRLDGLYWLAFALAPAADAELGWVDLDRMWSTVDDRQSRLVVGSARMYLALLDGGPRNAIETSAELGRACQAALPATVRAPGRDDRTIATTSGIVVWEPVPRPDERRHRQVVVVAPSGLEADLSAWAWSDGDSEPPSLGCYLAYAASVRYQLRVWQDGQWYRDARTAVSDLCDELAGLVASETGSDPDPEATGPDPTVERRERLRQGTLRLIMISTLLSEMQRSVEIARSNMAAVLAVQIGSGNPPEWWVDDRRLADWFVQQLDDDRTFLAATRQRAAAVGDAVDDWLRRRAARQPAPPDLPLSGDDRSTLLRTLAEVFFNDGLADPVLSEVGLARSRRHPIGGSSSITAWSTMVVAMENGAVPAPYRGLLTAALNQFPHNSVFRRLASEYGVHREGG